MVKPRRAQKTVKFIDEYCQTYRNLFPEVRSFEYFKYLHLGIISDIKRKSLPAIAKEVGLENGEGLDHFLTESPWSVESVRTRRLKLILKVIKEEEIVVIIDETGDKKKGKTTDYVKRQYIGNLGKIENGIVAVTSYGVLKRVRCNKWREFERVFSTGKKEKRYIREIIFGKKRETRYWQVTNNKETLPKNSTWYIMTKVPKIKYQEVGNLYGIRNWVEYGLKQSKNELGWADFRVTDYSRIEKWWEIVMSAYLMVSLQSEQLNQAKEADLDLEKPAEEGMKKHPWWDEGKGWKNILNNLRLFIQPLCYFNLLKPWLIIEFKPQIIRLFCRLFFQLNQLINSLLEKTFSHNFYFSSA